MRPLLRALLPHAFAAALIATSGAAPPRPAIAATLFWNNAGGGLAGIAGNWNPVQVPTDADVLRFDLANTYTVTFGAGVDSVVSHHLWGGDVTLNFNTPHGVKNQFYVASQAGDIATARLTAGTLRMGYIAKVGSGNGASGTLRVNGGTSNLFQNTSGGTASLDVGGDDTGAGTGEVVVLGGGAVELGGVLRLGREAGGTGTLRVKGLGNTGSGTRRSHFFADAAAGDGYAGWRGGHGILEVTEGGLFRVGRDFRLAEAAGDVGEVTIGGENVIDSSEVRIEDDLLVCVNPSTAIGATGGTGTIVLDSLGVLVVDDSTVVGDPDGSSGLITIHPGARMATRHLILQQPTGGTIVLEGTLQVNGGALSTSTQRLTLPGATGTSNVPVLDLASGATATFTGTLASPPLTVASIGQLEMRVTGGSQVVANGGDLKVATGSGSFGRLSIGDGGGVTSDHAAVVGTQGDGQLVLEAGGSATFAGVDLGTTSGGFGNALIYSGAQLTSTGPFNLGGTTLFAGERGWATVLNGGVLSLTAPVFAGTIWPAPAGESRLRVDAGGRVEMTGTLTVRDQIEMNGGDVAGGSVALRGEGRIEGTGTVASAILAGTDTTVRIVATGPLTVGRDDAGGSFLMRGTLETAGATVVIQDPDSAIVGNVTLAGGTLELPALGGVLEAGKRLTGHGTVLGPLVNHGYIIGGGGLPLAFDGMITGLGQGVSADRLTFLYGGGFEGAGLVDAPVDAGPGTRVRATGDLTLGRTGAGNASTWGGIVETGPSVVTLRGDAAIVVNAEFVLGGGRLTTSSAAGLTALGGTVFRGRGEIDGPITLAGSFAPGDSAGRLQVNGGVTFASDSDYRVELGEHAAGEHDTLVVEGHVLVTSGTLLDIRLLPSFAAAPGDSFKVMEYDSHSGSFSDVTLNGGPTAGKLEVHYAADGVWLVMLQDVVSVGDHPGEPLAPAALRFTAVASPGSHPGVALALPATSWVTLEVFDLHGRSLGRVHDGPMAAGLHRLELPRGPEGAGTYFVRAMARGPGLPWTRTTKVTRLR